MRADACIASDQVRSQSFGCERPASTKGSTSWPGEAGNILTARYHHVRHAEETVTY